MRPNSRGKDGSSRKDRPSSNRRFKTQLPQSIKTEHYLQTEIGREKVKIERDVVLKILNNCTQSLIDLLGILQSFQQKKVLTASNLQKVSEHFFFLRSRFFRYQDVTHHESIRNIRNLLGAIKLLSSAVTETSNIMKDQGSIFVRHQQQFCQFFKYLFGKEYAQFNQKHMRKILQEIWNFTIFYQKSPVRVAETLNLWAHGISVPLNPARMHLHKAVIKGDTQFIKKACQLKLKSPIYCHINEADANGITPLMLAVYLQKQNVLSALLLEHADPYLVPLTRMPNPKKHFQQITEQIQLMRGPLKMLRMPLSQPYTRNIIEYCRDNNIQLLAKLLALDTSRELYYFKSNKGLIEALEKIPDCSFQITWKQQAKLFGEAYTDSIKVYKKRASLRFDFNVLGVFDKSITKGSHSLIFKGKPDIEYYWVDYNGKKITNLIKEIDIKQLEERIVKIVKDTTVGRQTLTECLMEENTIKNTKGSYKQTTLHLTFEKENTKSDKIAKQEFKRYQDCLVASKVIDYSKLTHSQVHYVLEEHIPSNYPQPSRKKTQEKVKLQVNTIPFFQLSMDNLLAMSGLLRYFSPHFNKVIEVLKWQRTLQEMCCKGIHKQFPSKIVAEMKGIHLTILFQNFNFNPNIKNQMFQLLSRLEEESFDCVLPRGTSFVRSEQQSVQSSFMSSVTKFLRPEEQESEFGQACLRYQKLLGELDDAEDPTLEGSRESQNQKKISVFSKKNKSPSKER